MVLVHRAPTTSRLWYAHWCSLAAKPRVQIAKRRRRGRGRRVMGRRKREFGRLPHRVRPGCWRRPAVGAPRGWRRIAGERICGRCRRGGFAGVVGAADLWALQLCGRGRFGDCGRGGFVGAAAALGCGCEDGGGDCGRCWRGGFAGVATLRARPIWGLRARRLCLATAARTAAGTAGAGRGIAGGAHDGRTKQLWTPTLKT
jgi:hypothetical protein